MFDRLKDDILTLWGNTYNAQTWEQATAVLAILTTLFVSFIFIVRMLMYKNKAFLDWTFILREFGWFLIAFRFTTSLGLEWEGWPKWSWIIWTYVATTTVLAFLASQREHYYAKHRRGPMDRLLRRKKYLETHEIQGKG